MAVLDRVLASPGATGREIGSTEAWWRVHRESWDPALSTVDAAMLAGACMDRVAWAFASGYQYALAALDADADRSQPASLLATERGGGHPRAIATRVETDGAGRCTLTGEKRFATLASFATNWLVIANEGLDESTGRPRLCVVRTRRDAPGTSCSDLPETPFVPEVRHAAVTFAQTPGERLPGDGYAQWLKPFRTLEDVHVHAALLGHLTATASACDFPRETCQSLLALCSMARGLIDPAASPASHLALAGWLDATRALADALQPCWSLPTVPPDVRARWQRDRALMDVAAGVRAKRTASAWDKLAAR